MKQYIVDAFTDRLFGGNPAAVLPCGQMPPADWMLSVAIENNYSETAFVVKTGPGRYHLKWFTPGGEVDLCGHATLARFTPDFGAMEKLEGRGLIMTAASEEYDFVSRCFYPKLDVPEDPVTGSAHTYLTPFWAERLGKREMTARQISRRGGILHVSQGENRVFITGNAVLFMEGEIQTSF